MSDPFLIDELINELSPHATNCQDAECSWCDDANRTAERILVVVLDRLPKTPEGDQAFAARHGLPDTPGLRDVLNAVVGDLIAGSEL